MANTTLIYSFLIKSNACIYPSPPFIRSFHISSSANPLFSFFSSLSCRALHLYPLCYYRKCFFLGGSSCFQRIVFSMLEFCLGPRHLPSYSSSSSSIDPPPPPRSSLQQQQRTAIPPPEHPYPLLHSPPQPANMSPSLPFRSLISLRHLSSISHPPHPANLPTPENHPPKSCECFFTRGMTRGGEI